MPKERNQESEKLVRLPKLSMKITSKPCQLIELDTRLSRDSTVNTSQSQPIDKGDKVTMSDRYI